MNAVISEEMLIVIRITYSSFRIFVFEMWQLAEPNKVVSQKMKVPSILAKVLSYQRHVQSLKKIKPGIKI